MTGPPEIEFTGGSPSEDERRAVIEAIVALWRDDQAKAARSAGGLGGWVAAARAEGTGLRGARTSWRASAGMTQDGALIARRVGRGDTR